MAKTLFAVDELSGLRRRLRARPPDRDRGDEAEVGEEEAQAAVVRGRRQPRRGPRRAPRSSGVDFDEHVAFVIAAMAERADELGLGAARGAERRMKRRWKILIGLAGRRSPPCS